uniref:Uncharacterized protein n=1 Tax=Anopheles christyi TaxID=43041 RepID=A0A182JSV4_9DIPT
MSWVFHLLWMLLVLMLFFIVLRRIYYFGLQVHRPATSPSRTQTSQRFAVFTIYQNDVRAAQQPSERSQPPACKDPDPPPPPKYDDVIKSPDLFQKPPPYTAPTQA